MKSMSILFGFAFSLLLFMACRESSEVQQNVWKESVFQEKGQSNTASKKDLDFMPTSTTNQIVKHTYYTLSYNEKHEQAEWVFYNLKKEYLKSNNFKRPYFIQDPKVTTASADWRNYKNSGYDKGHLCPAGDMDFDQQAYEDTFFTSNISPQNHEFNSGIWNRLEQKTRYWAAQFEGLYVVTGGVLKDYSQTIGSEKVVVPNSFYKILFHHSRGNYKMIAFLIPNKKSDRPLYDYVIAVDELETITGIDFFHNLEDAIENKLEKRADYESWIKN